jgi:hypothetical protein
MFSEPQAAEDARVVNASRATFYGLWLFIMLVSVLDGFLSLRYRQSLPVLELNPLGRGLIAANDGHVSYLLAVKFVGTVLACAILLLIHQTRPRLGLIICVAVAALQLCLLLFLIWGDILQTFYRRP